MYTNVYKQGIMRATSKEIKKPSVYWEIIILILSIYVFIELAIEVIYPFDQQTQTILDYIDLGICVIFLYDFFHFFFTSEDKWKYLKKRWIDFIASIPFIGVLRILRMARIFRAVRTLKVFKILKGLKSFAPIINWISENKLRNILVIYVFILVMIMIYCSIAFYNFEKNINEFFDAFWWSFTTVTSISYGDIIPITKIGKIIAMILSLAGMGLFSVITAELSANFYKIIKNK